MIFVTVGTHEQNFNRLIEKIDVLKKEDKIKDEVVMQTGFSTYEPKYCKWRKLYPYNEMIENVRKARIVITHGGPSSFIMPLQEGKVPIVVPRKKAFDEHVNDHQLDFAQAVAQRQGNIIVVENVEEMEQIINNYEQIVDKMPAGLKSNNEKFNIEFEKVVDEIFAKKE